MYSKEDQTKHNRIKPKQQKTFGMSPKKGKNKSPKRKRKEYTEEELLSGKVTVRFNTEELRKRVDFIYQKGYCQVCDEHKTLDYPHHAKYGLGDKDDRFLVNICIVCHRDIHGRGYEYVPKTRKEIESIGWHNHLEYMNYSKDLLTINL